MMPLHLQKEIEKVRKKLVFLSAVVSESLHNAVKSFENMDLELAKSVVQKDFEIDELEVEVEEDCLKILALYQPVAVDLRFLIAVIKINNDLERIGDFAVSLADKVENLSGYERRNTFFDISTMASKVESMLRSAVDALLNMDASLARSVCLADQEVDNLKREARLAIIKRMVECTSEAEINALLNLMSISRHLERVADHATNIAEEVVYLVEGEIVRHRIVD